MYSTRHSAKTPAYILTADCPACGNPLTLRQPKTGAAFVGCSTWPRCEFRSAYDGVLHRLRDENARLRAEVTLLQLQRAVAVTAVQEVGV
jgi:ssDNA-binding Zn-finger/Zn-ribbon topoisomerase 1